MRSDIVLEERLWKRLPEHIFDLILARLPFPARCRLRCVCQAWKDIHSAKPPPCTILSSRSGDGNVKFYCDSEKKWFSLPSSTYAPRGRTWEVVDVDAGLVCYQCNVDGWFWLWICNPLKPSWSRLIVPAHARLHAPKEARQPPKFKLLVNRANKTYKVVAKLHKVPWTAVYESTTSCWQIFDRSPALGPIEFFKWDNVVYAYNPEKKVEYERELAVFNAESDRWGRVHAAIPSEFRFPKNLLFLSDNNQVVLVLFSYRKRPRPYFSVWKLVDDHEDSQFPRDSFSQPEN